MVWTTRRRRLFSELQPSFGRRQPPGDSRISLTGNVHRLGKGLEQCLNDVMRFLSVKQLQMEVAPRLVCEALKEFPCESEPEGAGHVLGLFRRGHPLVRKAVQAAPYQIGSSAEINHTPRQALVHGNISFAGEWVSRIKPGPVAPDAFLIPQRLSDS